MKSRITVCAGLVTLGALTLNSCSLGKDARVDAAQAKLERARAATALREVKLAAATKVKANELGQIPVLMYHRVVRRPATPEDRNPAQFRAEMERLAKEGYVPITAAEYVSGRIDLPAGAHPVVLTFDDASPSQLALDSADVPMQGTAVAILHQVAQRHPGFRPVATFYVTRDMFALGRKDDQARALQWLQRNGFDVGNHTRDHTNLRGRSQQQVAAQIAAGHSLITGLGGQAPLTLALPYGNHPSKRGWARKGTASGITYVYGGVFLAGYTPAPSPFAKSFDPLAIPRIRAGGTSGDCASFCSTGWLDWLKANPGQRYTSDGAPDTIAAPQAEASGIAGTFQSRALFIGGGSPTPTPSPSG